VDTNPTKGSLRLYSRIRADSAQHESVSLSPSASVDGGLLLTHPPASTSPPLLTFFVRERHLENFVEGLLSSSLRLLVAVSGLLSKDDYESLCPLLWHSCLTQGRSQIQTSVSSLTEVNPIDFGSSLPTGNFLDHAVRRKGSDRYFKPNKG
jgi:hypothetical protein